MKNQYWVGDCFVDLSRNRIERQGQSLSLQPKVLAVLTVLARNAGQVVSQDTLMSGVWADRYVASNTLQRCVAQLRKALGDGQVDADIARIDLTAAPPEPGPAGFNEVFQPYPSLARSTAFDSDGRFQPGGDAIAFLSERSGSRQLWLYDSERSTQLSRFGPGSRVAGFDWAPAGDRLPAVVNDRLVILSLDGRSTEIETATPVEQLWQWRADDRLLLEGRLSGVEQLLVYDMAVERITETGISGVRWAGFASGELIYLDSQRTLWRQSGSSKQVVELPPGQLNGKTFALRDGALYGINWQDRLWRYDLVRDRFETVQKLDPQIWWLSDVRDDQLLAVQGISVRKEIVEITE